MNRRKYLYALLIATVVVSSGCLVAAAVNTITMQWVKTFWVRQPRLPIECEIEIEEPKLVGYPVYINVTLAIEDEIDSVSGNLTVDLYWCNWTCNEWEDWHERTAENWQHVATLLEETNVTITQEGKTWACEYTPQWTGLYKVVVTFTTETGIETFTSEH